MKELCSQYILAKAAEAAAKNHRLSIEAEIIKAFNTDKLEGTETKAIAGFKVSVTSKLTRTLDYEQYQSLGLPENLGFVDMTPSINLKNLRVIERVDPSLVARCITVKPAKPSIKIEEVI